MKIWLNRQLVPESRAKISIWDRGFLYGDGVYETVRVYGGKIFRAEEHWKRLDHSLKGIRLTVPWSHSYWTRTCLLTAQSNRLQDCFVRITISRGIGELGYDPSTCKNPTLVILALPIRKDLNELWKKGVNISLVHVRRNHPMSLNPAIKSTNCLNGIFAKIESLKRGSFEGVFLNLENEVVEGTISNIFIVKGGLLKTPALACGLLDGVTRDAILETSKKSGIKVLETRLKAFEVRQADEVFLSSTTMEVMPVIKVDGAKVGTGAPGKVTTFLRNKFRNLLQKELFK